MNLKLPSGPLTQRFIAIAFRRIEDFINSSNIPLVGEGSPEGVVTAPIGALYTDTAGGAGTTLYVKESGVSNTGWIAK